MSGIKKIANAILNEPGFAGKAGGELAAQARDHMPAGPKAKTPRGKTLQGAPDSKMSGKNRGVAAKSMIPGGNVPKAL